VAPVKQEIQRFNGVNRKRESYARRCSRLLIGGRFQRTLV